ncbi:MAG: hypothetical protein JWN74_3704 [Acidobacteriaceae bacterium]|nr:hypothetical protein [Acidobacteriaceae bacterium]
MHHAIYNSPNLAMMLPSSRVRWSLCLCLLFSQLCFATDWHDPVSQLATQITAATGPGVVALEINNRSSIGSADVEEIRRELTSALATSGVRVWQPDQAAANIKLTLSENVQDYVWVAQVQSGTSDAKVILVSTPRPESAPLAPNAPPVTIHATPLVSQPDPILDVAILESTPPRIVVLGRTAITIQEFTNQHWAVVQSLPVSSPNPLPRDSRGRVFLRKDHLFDAYFPGLACHSTNSAPIAMNCSPSEDPWPLQMQGLSAFFSPSRNFFTGALVPGIGKQKSAPPFYSAAAIPRANYALWIFAGIDGQVHLLDGINQQVLGKIRWGSNVASVHPACRPDSLVLADAADSEPAESIQAFEVVDREPAAVSPKLTVNGSTTALWSTPGGENAIAVYKNSSTGNYEALQLTFDCGR